MSFQIKEPMESYPTNPTFAPAIRHPNSIASWIDEPCDSIRMFDATNVSPAPRESTTFAGGFANAAKCESVSLSTAIAPSIPHGQINFALQKNNFVHIKHNFEHNSNQVKNGKRTVF